MVSALILLVGSGIAAFGLVVMRNPMRLALLATGAEDYYQRMALNHVQRHQMRMLGMCGSFFGLVIFTAGLSGLLRLKILDTVYEGMLVLLWVPFVAGFGLGVIYSIVQVVRGHWKEVLLFSFSTRKRPIELGSTAVDPAITLRMRKETRMFTVIYCLLVALIFVIALVVR